MTEEDEAFEDLAKRQGDWGMQGSRKHQIMRYAENVENKGTSMTDKEAMAMALDALETEVSIDWTNNDEFNASAEKMHKAIAALKERLAQPAQRTEQERNFCSRCGKRTKDLTHIHTCTPPKEGT